MIEDSKSEQPELRPDRSWKRRLLRWTVLFGIVPYVVVTAGFGVAQRKFLYPRDTVESIQPENARLPGGQVHAIDVETPGGLRLNGWLVHADGQRSPAEASLQEKLQSDRFLILYFPGNSGSRLERVSDCRDFTALGCDVVLYDYRGYGDNPGSPSEDALAADALAIWHQLTAECHVPADRIMLFGESLGGGVATQLAAQLCQQGSPPAALVLTSTFSSMTDTVSWQYPYFPVRLLLLDRYPSAARIPSVTCPILVFHGAKDEMVPVELGRKLFAAAPQQSASGITNRFVELPRAGHNDIPKAPLRDGVKLLIQCLETQAQR